MRTCCNCWSRLSAWCFRVSPTAKAAGRRISCCCASTAALPSVRSTGRCTCCCSTPRRGSFMCRSSAGWPASFSCAFCKQRSPVRTSAASAAAGHGSRLRSACRYWRSTAPSGHPLQPDLVRHDDLALLLRHSRACLCENADGHGAEYAVLPYRRAVLCVRGVSALDGGLFLAGYLTGQPHLLVRYAADACDSGAAARHEKGGGSVTISKISSSAWCRHCWWPLCAWAGGSSASSCFVSPGWGCACFRPTSTPSSRRYVRRTPLPPRRRSRRWWRK